VALLLGASTGLALAGCGQIGGAANLEPLPARVRHLPLEVHGAPAPDSQPEIVQTIEVPREMPTWGTAANAKLRLLDRPLRTFHCLELQGEGPQRIVVPGHFVARQFNQIAVAVVVAEQRPVYVEFLSDGVEQRRSYRIPAIPSGDPLTLVFDLPTMQREQAVFDEIAIDFAEGHGTVGLVSVALVDKPHHLWLPDPTRPPEPVRIGTDWRPAVGLSSRRPMSTSFTQAIGARLEFDWAVPEGVRIPHVPLELEVRLEDEAGKTRSQRVPIETDMSVRSEWKSVSMGLDEFEGQISATFELHAPAEQDAYLALGEPRLVRRSDNAPTVLLITSDAHRADHVGAAHAGVDVATPFLDELAAHGVFFEDCFAASNETHPCHAALMTGLSPRDTGILTDTDTLSDDAVTLAERFRVAGFLNFAAVSFASLGPRGSGLEQGFDRVSAPPMGPRDSSETLAAVGDWLARSEGLPVFVWIHVADAHDPYDPPEIWRRGYYDVGRDPRDESREPPPAWMLPEFHAGVRDTEYVCALYRAEVSYLDDQLSRLLGYGRFQSGVIAFTADHGESLTAHDVYFGHDELYPDTLAIPLIITAPDLAPRRESRPASQLDIGKTLLDLAGVTDDFPGTNLLAPNTDRFGDQREDVREEPRFSIAKDGLSASVAWHDRFLVLHLEEHRVENPNRPPIPKHSVEFYDLADDPGCLHELSQERHQDAAELRAMLIEWLDAARPKGLNVPALIQDSATIEALASTEFANTVRHGTLNDWFDADCGCKHCRAFR